MFTRTTALIVSGLIMLVLGMWLVGAENGARAQSVGHHSAPTLAQDVPEPYEALRSAQDFQTAAALIVAGFLSGAIPLILYSRRKSGTSEMRLNALVADCADILSVTDANGVIAYISPSVIMLLGYQPDEMVGLNFLDFTHPEDIPRVVEAIKEVVDTENGSREVTFRFRRSDGSWAQIEAIGRNRIDDPTVRGIVINARDVTDRKCAESALQQSEARFRAITENTTDVTIILDKDGNYKYVSPAAAKIAGQSSEELLGTSSFDLVLPADLEVCQEAVERALRNPGDTVFIPNLRARYLDGRIVHFEALLTGMLNVRGVEGVVAVCRDLTERRHAEEEIWQAVAERNLILETARISITLNQNRKIVRADAAFESLFGWNSKVGGEIDTKVLFATVEDYQRIGRESEEVMSGGGVYQAEFLAKRKDGSVFWCRGIGKLLNPDDPSNGLIWLTEDITERKHSEDMLLRFEQIVSASTDMIAFVDCDYRYQAVNEAYQKAYGRTADEVIGRTAEIFLGDEAFDRELRPRLDACLLGAIQKWDGWLELPGTDRRYMEISYYPTRDKNNVVVGVAIIGRDLSDRKEAEGELLAYQRIVSATPDLMSFIDCDYRYQAVNDAHVGYFGVPTAEIMGRKVSEFVGEEYFGQVAKARLEACFEGQSARWHDWIEYPVPGRRCMDVVFEPVRNNEGEVIGVANSVRDITDLRLAEENFRRIDAERDHILRNAGIMIFLTRGRKLVRANGATEAVCGWNTDELPGMDVERLYARSDELARVEREGLPLIRDGRTYRTEVVFKRKDGAEFQARVVGSPLDSERNFQDTIWMIEDISRRKEAEEQLKQYSAERQLVLENARITITLTRDRQMIRMDDAFEEVFGWPPEEFLNKDTAAFFVHDEDYRRLGRDAYPILEQGKTYETEVLYKRKDGTSFWGRVVGNAVNPDDLSQGLIWLTEDITERKKNEELGNRFGRIIEESLNEIYVFDSETLKFLQVNEGARKNLRYSDAELKELTPVDIKPEFTKEQFEELLTPLREGTEPRLNFETVHQRKDGSTYDVNVYLQYVQTENPPVFAAIIDDISQNKLIEQELRQAQRMEAVGQLTGGISHDFNNLLGIILASVELVDEALGDDPRKKLLQKAIQAVNRGENLTGRLLAFSRKQTLQPRLIDINQLVVHTSEMHRRTIPESIEIQTHLSTGVWMTKVDPSQLEDALLNLAINARDAMPNGGTLTIRTRNEPHSAHTHPNITMAKPGKFVRISIADTGIGMSEETLAHVFEPFFTTKEVGEGSGLGLSMVYGFAKQSGGHVTIESREGEGTTVNMCLPAEEGEVLEEAAEDPVKIPRGSGEAILVVEDDPEVRDVTAALLNSLGYKTLEAGNGQEGLSVLEAESSIELLLSDVVLPGGMNGVQLQGEALKRRLNLKCILMSGYTDLPDGILPDGLALLNKPVSKRKLAHSVHAALHQGSA